MNFVTVVQVLSSIGICISSILWFVMKLRELRSLRLQFFLGKSIKEFKMNGMPLVLKEHLANDVRDSILLNNGGVKIIWGPQGSGKTTTVRRVLKQMKERNLIRGATFITPPDNNEIPSVWFRNHLSDIFGNFLKASEKLSQVLPDFDGRPFVIVLDQLENVSCGEEMRRFIKTLAEDSCLTKAYVVFALCADTSKVRTMWDWNGHEKIVLLSDFRYRRPSVYRWDDNDVEKWLIKYEEIYPLRTSTDREQIKEAAIIAGTPGFLLELTSFASANTSTSTTSTELSWKNIAEFKSLFWKNGEKILQI